MQIHLFKGRKSAACMDKLNYGMGFGISIVTEVPATIEFELIYLTSNSGIRLL